MKYDKNRGLIFPSNGHKHILIYFRNGYCNSSFIHLLIHLIYIHQAPVMCIFLNSGDRTTNTAVRAHSPIGKLPSSFYLYLLSQALTVFGVNFSHTISHIIFKLINLF